MTGVMNDEEIEDDRESRMSSLSYDRPDFWCQHYTKQSLPYEWLQSASWSADIATMLLLAFSPMAIKDGQHLRQCCQDEQPTLISDPSDSDRVCVVSVDPSLISLSDSSVLVLGCGLSDVSLELYGRGFTAITSMDISSVAIDICKKRYTMFMPEAEWIIGDVMTLSNDIKTGFSKFHLILEKSLIDCLKCRVDSDEIIGSMMSSVSQLLVSEGLFVAFSFQTAEVLDEIIYIHNLKVCSNDSENIGFFHHTIFEIENLDDDEDVSNNGKNLFKKNKYHRVLVAQKVEKREYMFLYDLIKINSVFNKFEELVYTIILDDEEPFPVFRRSDYFLFLKDSKKYKRYIDEMNERMEIAGSFITESKREIRIRGKVNAIGYDIPVQSWYEFILKSKCKINSNVLADIMTDIGDNYDRDNSASLVMPLLVGIHAPYLRYL